MRPADAVGHVAEVAAEHRPGARRRGGVHHTPTAVAARVVRLALQEPGGAASPPDQAGPRSRGRAGSPCPDAPWTPGRVIDPAVGGGAFLVAAADGLVDRGVAPADVLALLAGGDLDPIAVGAARVAVALWAAERGISTAELTDRVGALVDHIRVADGLSLDSLDAFDSPGPDDGPPGDDRDQAWLVISNPPFLSPLATDTAPDPERRAWLRHRFGGALAAQTDLAALFWLAAVQAGPAGSRIAMVLPESIVGAAHAGAVRRTVDDRTTLTAAWWPGDAVFPDAEVRVCVPLVRVKDPSSRPAGDPATGDDDTGDDDTGDDDTGDVDDGDRAVTRLVRGHHLEAAGSRDLSNVVPGHRLAEAMAGLTGVPGVPAGPIAGSRERLGDRARLGAGFRDQFYGLIPVVTEAGGPDDDRPRLVTSGVIDPFSCLWGDRPVRFARRTWRSPVVDLDTLVDTDSDLAAWVSSWGVPKVVVATQTRVIEACVDQVGHLVPSVPTVAVVPVEANDLWHIAAWVGGPVASAALARRVAGTGMGPGTLRVSAGALRDLASPVDVTAWDRAAVALAELVGGDAAGADPITFGGMMAAAHGLEVDHPVVEWWVERLPAWPRSLLA